MIERLLWRRPRIEAALSELNKTRLQLPRISLAKMFPAFDITPVTIEQIPIGPWSSPLADVVMLMKLVALARPALIMEVGSYRGFTALMIAKHAPAGARIVTVDREPQHGAAYRDRPEAATIERRVCDIEPIAFAEDLPGSYDLIFLDADHSYASVKRDTEILLPLIKPNGHFVWHDYGNWGKFSGKNGVPEFLHELGQQVPVAVVIGSQLGVHSPIWAAEGAARYAAALVEEDDFADPWTAEASRG